MISNDVIFKRVIEFLKSTSHHNSYGPLLPDNLAFCSYGGSRLHDTDEKTSDNDVRAIAVLNTDYILGLYEFDHTKVNDGKNGITGYDDLDVEVFHYDSFFRRLISGESTPSEMLHTPKNKIIFMNHLVQPIFDNKDLFFSKQLIRHYKGAIFRHINQMKMSAEKAVKQEKIDRILAHGFDTKEMMKAILYLLISIEFLETGILNLYRHDHKELLQIKHGSLSLKEGEDYIQELIVKRDQLVETSTIPEKPVFEKLNEFYKEYQLFIFKEVGIL